MADKSIKEITPIILKTFMLEIISRENLNYKAYSAIATIPRQLFDYCVELDLLESNPMDKVKIKKNVFRHDKKPDAKTQVFSDMEKELSEHLILKEFPKTADGNRDIPLSEKAKRILEMAIEWNMLHGYISSEFIFIDKKGERITRKRLDTTIRRYCKLANIPPRSCHKIRKTFISTLYDAIDISKDEVRKISGHSDLAVTNSCYVFNRNPASQTLEVMNNVL